MQDFNKSAKTEQELLDLLISRGLSVSDKEKAICYLKKVGYYRLSAYWYSFREKAPNNSKKRLDIFVPGASFDDAVLLYNFDTRLRALVFEAIGVFEIRLKSALVQYLTLRYENDPFVHERGDVAFNRNFNHAKWLEHIHDSTQHAVNSNEFLRHYKSTYSGFPKIPVWMVMEILSLGEVSKLLEAIRFESPRERQKLQEQYRWNLYSDWHVIPRVGESWIPFLCIIRNICAHHARLWNRCLAIRSPLVPDKKDTPDWPQDVSPTSMCFTLLILRQILKNEPFFPDWQSRIVKLLSQFDHRPALLESMGFPKGWNSNSIRC